MIDKYGVDSDKITLGLAFYGRSSKTTGDPGLFVPTTGYVDDVTFPEDEGNPLYYNILNKLSLFEQHYDVQSQVPYLTGANSLQTFVSYDNQHSIAEKAQYIIDNGLKGAIIWEITGDYIETYPGSGVVKATPLADTLISVLNNTNSSNEQPDKTLIRISPNPTCRDISIYMDKKHNTINVETINVFGELMESTVYFENSKIDMKIDYPPGVYLLKITIGDNEVHTFKVIKEK